MAVILAGEREDTWHNTTLAECRLMEEERPRTHEGPTEVRKSICSRPMTAVFGGWSAALESGTGGLSLPAGRMSQKEICGTERESPLPTPAMAPRMKEKKAHRCSAGKGADYMPFPCARPVKWVRKSARCVDDSGGQSAYFDGPRAEARAGCRRAPLLRRVPRARSHRIFFTTPCRRRKAERGGPATSRGAAEESVIPATPARQRAEANDSARVRGWWF
uniref:Uncharacterized protein n=1 Tax=Heliothis virescens TaxID=7102 RepID=A0A2A4IXZ1_HELVI